MRDGIGLAIDVYRPRGNGPFPVLLERTPCNKSAPSRSERTAAVAQPRTRAEFAGYFVRHGYAVVYQDCRGRYKSGGRFTKYLSEAEDGYDTLFWLMRQTWCNGRIGTFGLAFGSDTAGSVRIPSCMTGNVGLKVTLGRWSTEGVVPLSPTFDTPGTGFGRPAPGPSSCASPSCARAVISRPSWSRAAWP